jgi:hypothetical protein
MGWTLTVFPVLASLGKLWRWNVAIAVARLGLFDRLL